MMRTHRSLILYRENGNGLFFLAKPATIRSGSAEGGKSSAGVWGVPHKRELRTNFQGGGKPCPIGTNLSTTQGGDKPRPYYGTTEASLSVVW